MLVYSVTIYLSVSHVISLIAILIISLYSILLISFGRYPKIPVLSDAAKLQVQRGYFVLKCEFKDL